jgi:hypothetical protein
MAYDPEIDEDRTEPEYGCNLCGRSLAEHGGDENGPCPNDAEEIGVDYRPADGSMVVRRTY